LLAFFTERQSSKTEWRQSFYYNILRMGPQSLKQKALQVYCDFFNDSTCTTATNTPCTFTQGAEAWMGVLGRSFPQGAYASLKCILWCMKYGEAEFLKENPNMNRNEKNFYPTFLGWLQKNNNKITAP
jgi:hypothetical protein